MDEAKKDIVKTETPRLAEPKNVHAELRFLRMSPTKVRLVANLIKGLDVERALHQLQFITKTAKNPIRKLLDSAVANAVHNFHLDRNNLYIKIFTVDGGPTVKRWRARAFGKAGMIRKRTSHLTVVLSERVPTVQPLARAEKSPDKSKDEVKTVRPEDIKLEKPQGIETTPAARSELDEKKKQGKGFVKKIFSRKTG